MRRMLLSVLVVVVSSALVFGAPGGKKRVAILDFDFASIQHWWEGNWDIGKGISDLLVTRLVKNGTWLSPTFMPQGGVKATATRNADLAKYVPAALRGRWQQQAAGAPDPASPSPAERELAERVASLRREIVTIMKRGGVQFVVGTDSGGAWRIPGRSLHEGLEEMTKAGLTPMETIQAATLSSAG